MKHIKFKIFAKIIILQIIVIFMMSQLVPLLLNYPPNSEEPIFQSQIEPYSHTMQYLSLGSAYIILYIIMIRILFKNIFKYLKKDKKKVTYDEVKKIRNQCMDMPYRLTLTQVILITVILFALFFSLNTNVDMCFRFLLVYFAFFTMVIIISNVLIRSDLNEIIKSTYNIYNNYEEIKQHDKFYRNLMFNLTPFSLVIIITISLLGYAKVCDSIGERNYFYYKGYLENINFNNYTISQIEKELSNITLNNETDYYFIKTNNTTIFSKNNKNANLSHFFLTYADTYLKETNGRVYEYYGVAEEGYAEKITLANGESALIGFKYETTSSELYGFFITISLIAILAYLIIIYICSKNISKNISEIAYNLSDIAKKQNIIDENNLPILSNDELGELTDSFNKIKSITRKNIETIHDNQDMLVERERFASLGQMIGGIAHNLKTPIMSIAGATEGINDLIKEYEQSISDPDVTVEDHHDIAKDMKTWVYKIKDYTEYMSDVITAVKGQAVTETGDLKEEFLVTDLVKQVDILMKHELKNALVDLNIESNINSDTSLYGNINSLVQVLNNMISNAIQSYQGKPNNHIDLIINEDENNVFFEVKDYGAGISKDIQEKLFKEMITTKGKNGTGLGLFMSYSNVKAHFNGNITFESEPNKGTTFIVSIPKVKVE